MNQIYVFDTNIISEVLDTGGVVTNDKDFDELPIRKENWLRDGGL